MLICHDIMKIHNSPHKRIPCSINRTSQLRPSQSEEQFFCGPLAARSYKKVSRRKGTRVALAHASTIIYTAACARANNAHSAVCWQAMRASTNLGVGHPWCTLRDDYSLFPFSRSPHARGPCVQLCLITVYRSVMSSRC